MNSHPTAIVDDSVVEWVHEVAKQVIPSDPQSAKRRRGQTPPWDEKLWRSFVELGWFELDVLEETDGPPPLAAAAAIAHALGSAGRLEPFVSSAVLPALLLARLTGERSGELLADCVAGTTDAVVCWQNDSDRVDPQLSDLPVLDAGTLDGTVEWVPSLTAGRLLVLAQHGGDLALVVVPGSAQGVRIVPHETADGSELARIIFGSVPVPPADVIAHGEELRAALEVMIDAALVLVSAQLAGAIDRMLELTVSYVTTRVQFGQPIGAFQAVQHRIVDMWVQQQLTAAALRRILDGGYDASVYRAEASGLKARAAAAARMVGNSAVQLHGAIGFTDEYELGHLVNRSLVLAAWLGSARSHRRRRIELLPVRQPE